LKKASGVILNGSRSTGKAFAADDAGRAAARGRRAKTPRRRAKNTAAAHARRRSETFVSIDFSGTFR